MCFGPDTHVFDKRHDWGSRWFGVFACRRCHLRVDTRGQRKPFECDVPRSMRGLTCDQVLALDFVFDVMES